MSSRFFILLFSCFLLFESCSTDLEVNAEWKETAIVYGLLDVNDSVHYIKINKAFLNEDLNALEIAQNSDSLFIDSLIVTITNLSTDQIYTLVKDNSIPKDPGIFANNVNYLYRLDLILDPNQDYRLDISSPKTGKHYTSRTNLVHRTTPLFPNPTTTFDISAERRFPVNWRTARNAKVYELHLLLYYTEINVLDTNIREEKTINWIVASQLRTTQLTGNQTISETFKGTQWFDFLANNIAVDTTVMRRPQKVDFIYYGGGEELDLYLSINQPSLSIVQKRPEYSNIENGLGIFSSRNTTVLEGLDISDTLKASLKGYEKTRPLNFIF